MRSNIGQVGASGAGVVDIEIRVGYALVDPDGCQKSFAWHGFEGVKLEEGLSGAHRLQQDIVHDWEHVVKFALNFCTVARLRVARLTRVTACWNTFILVMTFLGLRLVDERFREWFFDSFVGPAGRKAGEIPPGLNPLCATDNIHRFSSSDLLRQISGEKV